MSLIRRRALLLALLSAASVSTLVLAGGAGAVARPLQGSDTTASPCGQASAPAGWEAAGGWNALSSDFSGAGSSTQIYLTASITAGSGDSLGITSGHGVTLDLCGQTLSIESPNTTEYYGMPAITVPAGATFTVEDDSAAGDGQLIAVGGEGEGDEVAGSAGGAGIGGGGGVTYEDANVAAAGGAGSVIIEGGEVTATGGAGEAAGAGGGAGIGGGGGSVGQPGGTGGTVTIDGGTLNVSDGAAGPSGSNGAGGDVGAGNAGAGIGAGGAGNSGSTTVSAGSVEVSGPASLSGEVAGGLTVDSGVTLTVPGVLALDGSSANDGVVDVDGTLDGGGSFSNLDGVVVVGASGENNLVLKSSLSPLALTFPESSGDASSDVTLSYGRETTVTLASAGVSLPTTPAEPGFNLGWYAGSTLVSSSTDLLSVEVVDTVALSAVYAALSPSPSTSPAVDPCGSSTAPAGWLSAGDWSDLSGEIDDASSSGATDIYLTGSITAAASGSLSLPPDANVTLDLCGQTLTIAQAAADNAGIEVPTGTSLTVQDTSTTDVADQGDLVATGGPAGVSTGAGAGIGGDADTTDADSGSVTIDGGNLVATGGDASSSGGAGAGIGGGGGDAGLGGGALSGTVTLSGGTVSVSGGAAEDGGGAAGDGLGGGGSDDSSGAGSPGSVDVSGPVSLYGEVASAMTVESGQTLTVPVELTLDGSIDLEGTLGGGGSLVNDGVISLSGDGSIPGNGVGGSEGELSITGNIYDVTFSLPAQFSRTSAPSPEWVYAPSFSAAGLALPAVPSESGYTGVWEADGSPIVPSTAFEPLERTVDGVPTVAVDADYARIASVRISGVRNDAKYRGVAPFPVCDGVGTTSCRLTMEVRSTKLGYTEAVKATGRTAAGTTVTARVSFRVRRRSISGGSAAALPSARGYELWVVSHARPRYVAAVKAPRRPSGRAVALARRGSIRGIPQWTRSVKLSASKKARIRWHLGIRLRGKLTVLTVKLPRI